MRLRVSREAVLGTLITVAVFGTGLLVVAMLLDFVVMPMIVKEGAETRVPDVINLSLQAAEARLNQAGLGLIIGGEEFDSDRPKGAVIAQRPEPGATVKKARRVILTISKGSASAVVPKLNGYTLREARFLLEKEGLEPGNIIWFTDETMPDGVILGSLPTEGTVMKLNARVQLVVNRRETGVLVRVPDFVGLDIDEAKVLAEENFLLIGQVAYKVDDRLLPETVVAQSIPEGVDVEKWTVVDLTVSALE